MLLGGRTSPKGLQQATRLARVQRLTGGGPFYRWIKRNMAARHPLCQGQRGVTTQVYVAFIASLPISPRIGHKPTKRTYEMIRLF